MRSDELWPTPGVTTTVVREVDGGSATSHPSRWGRMLSTRDAAVNCNRDAGERTEEIASAGELRRRLPPTFET